MSGTALVTRASLGRLSPVIAPVPMTQLPARVWSRQQWDLIKRGYLAQDMDEKWDVFVENHVAFLHRSWTGNGVFEATFSPAAVGWRISGAVVGSSRVRVRCPQSSTESCSSWCSARSSSVSRPSACAPSW